MNSDKNGPMNMPLDSLELSNAFKKAARENGCTTLGSILKLTVTDIVNNNWLTAPMIAELAEFVKKKQLR
jgi:hypothetical protein